MIRTILVLVTFLMVSAGAPTGALAQQPGDGIQFLIPATENQPQPTNTPQEKLIYSGGRLTSVDITGCGAGNRPMQNAVLVDPAGGRSGRIVGVITVSQTDPVPPGTRVGNLALIGPCVIVSSGVPVPYMRWEGIVE
jgi:hypothetical protein